MSDELDTNYFVCTLGQATVVNKDQNPIDNINDFINYQGQNKTSLPAVGFPAPAKDSSSQWTRQLFTFGDIWKGSAYTADICRPQIQSGKDVRQQETVALLCPSTPNFLFMWLGLIRLGHAVLLIAPQCQPAAIAHLCKTCNVSTLFYDDFYEELALDSVKTMRSDGGAPDFTGVTLPIDTESKAFQEALKKPSDSVAKAVKVTGSTVGYLHHTSGTSTGLPKPIPQTHHAGLGVLPRFSKGHDKATFTTTPLYHGGVADSFRAWAGNAMIWLFPGKGVPITAKNIVFCLAVAETEHRDHGLPAVKYFASVPYVLQMMAGDASGLENLQKMDIAGVGGAALPAEVGDDLVSKGVNLISRFGSAECGFLMSSHRDYAEDKEWQYLRSNPKIQVIDFEEREDGNFELIVLPDWPHRAKTNRDNGSFASADLFAPHPSIPNAWRYHSRADSQLTLITGKKFDPAPLESAIATSNLIDDVLIFGNGRPFPGALLFRSAEADDMSSDDLIAALAPAIEKLNAESQSHARIPRNMLVPVASTDNKLQKSSKGTILRNKAEETFASTIEDAYARLFTAGISGDTVPDTDVASTIQSAIERILGEKAVASKPTLTPETDLFAYGVDSVASIQIRYTLKQLLPDDVAEPPLSIVEDCGSIGKLAAFVLARRHGEDFEDAGADDESEHKLMRDLVEKYADISGAAKYAAEKALVVSKTDGENAAQAPTDEGNEEHDNSEGQVIVLTGATGALGANVLSIYRADPTVSRIYCLVRGASPRASRERVSKSLSARGLKPLSNDNNDKITVLQSSLSEPLLGLSPTIYARLARTATTVMHIAWAVNFRMRLSSFEKDHIGGLQNLLALASSTLREGKGELNVNKPVFAFCSSVASVTSSPASMQIEEFISTNPATASPLGYSRSKWVAEAICARAAGAGTGTGALSSSSSSSCPPLRNRIAVFRVGQLSGDTVTGTWNANEAWPLMLASVRATGCLPRLEDEAASWLAVDIAARAMVEGAASVNNTTEENNRNEKGNAKDELVGEEDIKVIHVLNPHTTPTFPTLLSWLTALERDKSQKENNKNKSEPFSILSPSEWIKRMDKLQTDDPDHPSLRLLGLWRSAYGEKSEEDDTSEAGTEDDTVAQQTHKTPRFSLTKSKVAAPVLETVGPVDEVYFGKLWRWIVRDVVNSGEREQEEKR